MSAVISLSLVAGARIDADVHAEEIEFGPDAPAPEAIIALAEWFEMTKPHGLEAFPFGSSDVPEGLVVGLAAARIEGVEESISSIDLDLLDGTFGRAKNGLAVIGLAERCAWHLVRFET